MLSMFTKHAHFKGQALLLSHLIGQGGSCSIGGSRGNRWCTPPLQQDPILLFSHVFTKKHTCQVGGSPWVGAPPQREILDPPLCVDKIWPSWVMSQNGKNLQHFQYLKLTTVSFRHMLTVYQDELTTDKKPTVGYSIPGWNIHHLLSALWIGVKLMFSLQI